MTKNMLKRLDEGAPLEEVRERLRSVGADIDAVLREARAEPPAPPEPLWKTALDDRPAHAPDVKLPDRSEKLEALSRAIQENLDRQATARETAKAIEDVFLNVPFGNPRSNAGFAEMLFDAAVPNHFARTRGFPDEMRGSEEQAIGRTHRKSVRIRGGMRVARPTVQGHDHHIEYSWDGTIEELCPVKAREAGPVWDDRFAGYRWRLLTRSDLAFLRDRLEQSTLGAVWPQSAIDKGFALLRHLEGRWAEREGFGQPLPTIDDVDRWNFRRDTYRNPFANVPKPTPSLEDEAARKLREELRNPEAQAALEAARDRATGRKYSVPRADAEKIERVTKLLPPGPAKGGDDGQG